MKIISTNIGQRREVNWKGKILETGIFKSPVNTSIYLGTTDVKDDQVIDRKHHGGIDKACYAYSADHYSFWSSIFPNVDMTHGAFGENLTIEGLNENEIKIGDQYQIGKDVIVEVSQPRQPCLKLGIRFNDQKIVKHFINEPFSGVYLRIIQEGNVENGDVFKLVHRVDQNLNVAQVHSLLSKDKNVELAKIAILMDELASSYKQDIQRIYQL